MMSILGREALAQSHRMQYHGGKVLPTFTIYPLYYGAWSARDIEAQQQYLHGLAAYLSGHYNPPQQQTMMKQYGVHSAAVAGAGPPVQATSPLKKLSGDEIQTIIHEAQGRGELPAYAADRLIMVFPAHGFGLDVCDGCGYHSAESSSAFWAVVPQDSGPSLALVTAHEVFEAAADPDYTGWSNAVEELVDGCGTTFDLGFGLIPGVHDNTQNGACSTTGFIAGPTPSNSCGILRADQGLIAGTAQASVLSCDRRFALVMQTDGNLVLYQRGGRALWATNTVGSMAVMAVMQRDGNFVSYRGLSSNVLDAVWATGTVNQRGAFLQIQNDGNLVVYNSSNRPLWASGTCCR